MKLKYILMTFHIKNYIKTVTFVKKPKSERRKKKF